MKSLSKKQQIFITTSAEKTREMARNLAKTLRGGEIIALIGGFGSGKTTFVQGLAKGLGIKQKIQSPTFVFLKEYAVKDSKTRIKYLVHMDFYRIESVKESLYTGVSDYLGAPDTVCVIEWAEKIKRMLPRKTIYINFEQIDEYLRRITIKNYSRPV